MRIALVSTELDPIAAGGVGVFTGGLARELRALGEVTIFVPSPLRAAYHRFCEEGWTPPAPIVFVEEPGDEVPPGYLSSAHCYSDRIFRALLERYPEGGPDLVEFPDFLGTGFVTLQARRTGHARLRNTTVCVGLHTTAEIADVLNGFLRRDPVGRLGYDFERFCLRFADALLTPGGDVLATYCRFYGTSALAPARLRRYPAAPVAAPPTSASTDSERLSLAYVGRLERRKGVLNLLRAATALPGRRWQLTLVGADTSTGPLGASVRDLVEQAAAGDERIRVEAPRSRAELAGLLAGSDACVVPSLWECWPNVALEALSLGVPVIATPVGGLVEQVESGRTGLLTSGTSAQAIGDALERVVAQPQTLRAMGAAVHGPQAWRRLTDPAAIVEAYRSIAAVERPRRTRPSRPLPLVSVVVPYYRLDRFVERTIASVFAQTHRPLEVIVVNDGSLWEEDRVLLGLASRYPVHVLTQPNAGLGAARNFGIAQCKGDYVLPLDADNELEKTFLEACVQALESDPELAYVTTWSTYIDELGRPLAGADGYRAVGNSSLLLSESNLAGDAVALFRRRVFERLRYDDELASFEDWSLYRVLARRGAIGHVVPEALFRYRVRGDSMLRSVGSRHTERLMGELAARDRLAEIDWCCGRESLSSP